MEGKVSVPWQAVFANLLLNNFSVAYYYSVCEYRSCRYAASLVQEYDGTESLACRFFGCKTEVRVVIH